MLSGAQPVPVSEVKAAFVLNFTKFVEWPDASFRDDHSPFSICVIGQSSFAVDLARTVRGETVNGRPVAVEYLPGLPQPKHCQMVVVGSMDKANDRNLLRALAALGPGILTVGDGENFVRDGGIIGFVVEKRRVRFDINQGAATRSLLTLSARLLSVARAVQK
jgi:hypothetical protein